jgi:hypothetical protein
MGEGSGTRAHWFGRCPCCKGPALYGYVEGGAIMGVCSNDLGCGWSAHSGRAGEGPAGWLETALEYSASAS